MMGGRDDVAALMEQTMTKEQIIAERDAECSRAEAAKTQEAARLNPPTELPPTHTPYIPPPPTHAPYIPPPTPTLAPTPTPIPPELLSIAVEYDPTQTQRERSTPVSCAKSPNTTRELKITRLESPQQIADAQRNIFVVTTILTREMCSGQVRSEVVLEAQGDAAGDWTGYLAEWRTLDGVTVGHSSGPDFGLTLGAGQEPDYLRNRPLMVYMYDASMAELAPTPLPVNTPTPDETEIIFRYNPADYIRPRGQTEEYPKTLDLREQNIIISDVNGNRWQVAEVSIDRSCVKYIRRNSCSGWYSWHEILLSNNTRSWPDFTEYQARWEAEDGTTHVFTWKLRECGYFGNLPIHCGQQGKAQFFYLHPDTIERSWTVEIFDSYRRLQ